MKIRSKKSCTLFNLMQEEFPESSKSAIRGWIRQGRIMLGGKRETNPTTPLAEADEVEFLSRPKKQQGLSEIVYEDDSICVIDKPAGILTVATDKEKEHTLLRKLKLHYKPRPIYVVHRLDRDTSGLMLFAKTGKARDLFKEMFFHHELERTYRAIVHGRPSKSEGVWKSYLFQDKNYVVHEVVDPKKGRLAITNYIVLASSKNHTLLELSLETGRTNQIRVHCSSANIPVVGDRKYGLESDLTSRLCLHACSLRFLHPITKEEMTFTSNEPALFQKLVPYA